MCSVVMAADDRHRLGARLLREQNSPRFGGMKKAAYSAAKVTQATWENAINGRSMKDQKIRQIVVHLWPETEGDWRRIPGLKDAGDTYDVLLSEIAEAVSTPENYEVIRATIEAERRGEIVRLTVKKPGMA